MNKKHLDSVEWVWWLANLKRRASAHDIQKGNSPLTRRFTTQQGFLPPSTAKSALVELVEERYEAINDLNYGWIMFC